MTKRIIAGLNLYLFILISEKGKLEKGTQKEQIFLDKNSREDVNKSLIEPLVRTLDAGFSNLTEEE